MKAGFLSAGMSVNCGGQQDPYENDPWWFAPLLYTGAALVIAAVVLA